MRTTAGATPTTEVVSSPSERALTATALVLCMAVGPLLLYSLTAVSVLFVDDLRLSPVQYGLVATTVFGSAAVGSALLGRAADRVSSRRLFVLIAAGAGIGTLVVAASASYAWVLVGALVCGLAQSASNPATNRYLASWPPERRGPAIGLKQSGVQMSQLLAGASTPSLALLLGWRGAVASGAVIAVAAAVSGALAPLSGDAPRNSRRRPRLSNSAHVWALTAYTFLVGLGLAATNAYLPLFAHERAGLSVVHAGLTVAVVGLVGLASRVWWGRRNLDGHAAGRSLIVLATGSLAGTALIFSAQFAPVPALWAGAAVFGACALAANSVTTVALLGLVPVQSVGAASGRVSTGLYLGFATGPITFGVVLNRFDYALAWAIPGTAFVTAVLGAAVFLRLLPGRANSVDHTDLPTLKG